MKSFENVYNTSKNVALNEQQKVFAADKAKLLAAIKHEYGVKDFNSLSEAEKSSYKSMLNEMWNSSTGMTEKGIAFLNESKAVLTEQSTDEQIEKYFKKEFKACVENAVQAMASGKECGCCKEIKAKVEADTKKKLSNKVAKQWMYAVCCDYIGSKIKSIKF
jgi:energy-converting hydrogenase A subunit M